MRNPPHRYLIQIVESGLKRRPTFRYWRELERSQWLSLKELESLQFASLRRLIEHAAASCPYYRTTWREHGVDPRQLASLDDFQRWPLIDRETIREHRPAMRTPGAALIEKATGGSSGVPLQFDIDHDSNNRRMAAWHRGYGWAGAAPGTKQLYVWGVPLGNRPTWRIWKDALYNRLYHRQILNCFELRDDRASEFNSAILRYRPDVIVAYTNPLYALARAIDEQGLRAYVPKSIVVGAEKLHGFQRELIERVFQAPVFETYGSREFMLIGAECERHMGLHRTHENLLVELLDDDGHLTPAGEEGNVTITDLTNYGMPFIRYANGDRAIAGFDLCDCGRGLPLLKKVVGRRLDVLTTSDGRQVPGEFFPHLLKEFPAVRRFQVVQETPAVIELKLVLADTWSAADQQGLDEQIRAVVGDDITLRFARVDDIPLTGAGKLQVVVNRCAEQGTQVASEGAMSEG